MEHVPERPAQSAVPRTAPGAGREDRSTGNVLVPLRSALAPGCSSGNPSRLSQLLQRARGIRRRERSARPSRFGRRLAIRRLTLGPRLTYADSSTGSLLGYSTDQLTTPALAVTSTATPKAIRYHANGVKSCVAM